MIIKKTVIGLFLICLLSGCVQNVALLGPAYTFASSGNVYHAGLSYGSNIAVKEVTGKTTSENIKSFIQKKNEVIEVEEKENYNEFFALVKSRIDKTHKIIRTANR